MRKPSNSQMICTAMKALTIIILLHSASVRAQAQEVVENVILVTLDGLRPEEVFTGGDRRLMVEQNGVDDPAKLERLFWRDDPDERRELLLPFLWSQCNTGNGWIAGDVEQGSRVLVENGRYFSYPGYNEILTGAPDVRIDSNDKVLNENVTVLEWLYQKSEFQNRIAAYCSWDVFPFIINDKRSGIPVNAGWEPLTVGNPDRIEALNFVAEQLFHEWEGVRYDSFTVSGAIEELRTNKPRILFVSLGETDDWAHAGRYDRYLITAKQNDFFIKSLWELTLELPEYRDKTLFLVTTDHGRGRGREGWKSHSKDLPGSERIWVAAFGAGLEKDGIDRNGEFQQGQIAATIAKALGHDFTKTRPEIRQALPILSE